LPVAYSQIALGYIRPEMLSLLNYHGGRIRGKWSEPTRDEIDNRVLALAVLCPLLMARWH